ncbi:MAG: hypothetical protein LBM04_10870 [Opitutaceae bacterium]|jgi:hypothetical protein|nr:hypothetical protein [Opitutaceae bacterium]
MQTYQTDSEYGLVLVKKKQASHFLRLSIATFFAIFWIPLCILSLINSFQNKYEYVLQAMAAGFYVCGLIISPVFGPLAFILLMRQIRIDQFLGYKLLFKRIRLCAGLLLFCCSVPIGLLFIAFLFN